MQSRERRARIYLSAPHMSGLEQQYVAQAFESNWLSSVGPNLDAFEHEIAARLGGDVHAIAVTSGTAALHLVLRAAGVGPGDRVAVSTLTFAASVFPVLYLGATPVFVDSERVSWNLDPNIVEDLFRKSARLRRLPRVLIAIHLYGQHADLDPVVGLCERFGVTLVEDAAESLGGTYKGRETGTTAPHAILSFNGNKMITTTGGGMVITKDPDAALRIRKWATQSREPVVEYLHKEVGYNYRLSNVLAGIGRGQLRVLDERVGQRRAIAAAYRSAFAGIGGMALQPEAEWGMHSRWLSVFSLPGHVSPSDVVRSLEAEDIEARPVWRPMHTQPLFRDAEVWGGAVSEDLYATGLCLPSSSSLAVADQDRVVAAVQRSVAAKSTAGPASRPAELAART